ncbi:MAG: RNA degradosome polyphosphate kinase, partial [Granulosicoccaceae bacterium]
MTQEKAKPELFSAAQIETADLSDPSLYYNRELSLLQFHWRVLNMSLEPSVPLLERLRYLCISASNMDEFFEVRVAGLKQQLSASVSAPTADGLSPSQQLRLVSEKAHELVARQYQVLGEVLLPALEEEGISFIRRDAWTDEISAWVQDYFLREVLPVLTPLGLDPAHPFPNLLNKSLNFIVNLDGKDAFGRHSGLALLRAPRHLPRIIPLPTEVSGQPHAFVFLSSVIHAEVSQLFEGMAVDGVYQFKVTRNSDLYVSEEDVADLRRALEGELQGRDYGSAVRLEVADNCPQVIADFLLRQFRLKKADLYRVKGPVNLRRLAALPELIERPELKYPP